MNKKLLDALSGEWQRSSTRRMTYQKPRLYYFGLYHDFQSLFGFRQNFMPTRIVDGVVKQYLSKQESEDLAKHLFKYFTEKKALVKNYKKLRQELKHRFDFCLKGARSFNKNWQILSNRQLKDALDDYYQLDNKFGAFHWILFNNIEEILVEAIKYLMKASNIDVKTSKKMVVLARPILSTPLDMERLSILNCALHDKKNNKLIIRHWAGFASMPMVDIDYEPYSLKYFIKERDEIRATMSAKAIKGEMLAINKKYKQYGKQNEIYLNLFSGGLKSALRFYQDFANYKDRKPYVRDQINYYAKGLFAEVAIRLGVDLRQVLFMTEKELRLGLLGKLKIKKSELNARVSDSAYIFHNGQLDIITNKKDLAIIDSALYREYKAKELKGVIAFPGMVRAKVCVVLSNSDFGKFNRGDVLVSSATRPDFVPLMKRAAAIVTDEGGLLSHAAIISRELKVPCVVGTKHASETLKDGDLVEVDADNGIIKTIK